jgi:hypothetical protein
MTCHQVTTSTQIQRIDQAIERDFPHHERANLYFIRADRRMRVTLRHKRNGDVTLHELGPDFRTLNQIAWDESSTEAMPRAVFAPEGRSRSMGKRKMPSKTRPRKTSRKTRQSEAKDILRLAENERHAARQEREFAEYCLRQTQIECVWLREAQRSEAEERVTNRRATG